MVGNPGVYGTRRFERIDYSEGVAREEIATTAIDSTRVTDDLKTGVIFVQATDSGHVMIPKPPVDITLTGARMFASIGAATTGTAGSFSVNLLEASSGFATTTNIATVSVTGTVANALVEGTATPTVAISSTQALIAVFGATTLVDDNAGLFINYTVD